MFCFAYGTNMSRPDMARRAPGARALGLGRLDRHRLVVTAAGYLAVKAGPAGTVHGVVWRLTPRDLARLDAYEGLGPGRYRRRLMPIRTKGGARPCFVYHGAGMREGARLNRRPFVEAVLGPAMAWNLPAPALAGLRRLARRGCRG
jgi:gamma-glutamylcyclotransferase (GGCT)/AIG2-like uncharacterized protein YtfP